jgi:chaperonin cofactor prefoldin
MHAWLQLISNNTGKSGTHQIHTMEQQPIPATILQQYRELLSECQKIQGKISELEVDRAEHVLVEETLQPLDPERRAFRLVGECLVERTVKEVLPTVVANRENVSHSSITPLTFHNVVFEMFSHFMTSIVRWRKRYPP